MSNIADDLVADLKAGDWDNFGETPRILEWNLKNKDNNINAVMVTEIPGNIITDYQGKKIYEIKKAKIYGFSKNNRDKRDNLRDDTISILEDSTNAYDFETPEEYNEYRQYSYRIIIKRLY